MIVAITLGATLVVRAQPVRRYVSVSTSTVSRVSESDDMGITPVPDRVLHELADVLVDRVDQLLDRLTDRGMAAPVAGSPTWESTWKQRDTAVGHARDQERSRVRIELTRLAVAKLSPKHAADLHVPARQRQVVRPRAANTGRNRVDDAQLAFF
ncbi:hypothetical protein CH292_28115 [Rhodococcus sp. 14-2470-1a]|nr:hypothetical protein CH292_27870 [Rhodococcus sp. 14-2470-1a]OZF41364.1 hypothetical protein CH292_28115 [Rhodococcus sp. 14-2470-1a]